MVEIGTEPILWHIMKIYAHYGLNDFVICAGYKQELIKQYFFDYALTHGDISLTTRSSNVSITTAPREDWNVTIVDTGINTMTGGRIKRIEKLLNGERFMLTYGDGLANIDMNKLLNFHTNHGKQGTVTAVKPVGRFGALTLEENEHVAEFVEKPPGDGVWINGGFFVLEQEIFDLIKGDNVSWEEEPMMELASRRELVAFKHHGFWRPMDTMSDKRILEGLWNGNSPPWKVWNG